MVRVLDIRVQSIRKVLHVQDGQLQRLAAETAAIMTEKNVMDTQTAHIRTAGSMEFHAPVSDFGGCNASVAAFKSIACRRSRQCNKAFSGIGLKTLFY